MKNALKVAVENSDTRQFHLSLALVTLGGAVLAWTGHGILLAGVFSVFALALTAMLLRLNRRSGETFVMKSDLVALLFETGSALILYLASAHKAQAILLAVAATSSLLMYVRKGRKP